MTVHVQRICEARDTVMWFYHQQIRGSSGADVTTSMENSENKHMCKQLSIPFSPAAEER